MESSSRDESIINVLPSIKDEVRNPSCDGQIEIINVVASAEDNANKPSSEESPVSDGPIIDIGLRQSSDGVITTDGGLVFVDAGVPPVNDEGNKPMASSDGLLTVAVGFPEENNPIAEEFPSPSSCEQLPETSVPPDFPSPSSCEQLPVICDYSDPINTETGDPPKGARAKPKKRSVNTGRPGGTNSSRS